MGDFESLNGRFIGTTWETYELSMIERVKHKNYTHYHDTEGCKLLPKKKGSKRDEKTRLIHNIKDRSHYLQVASL